MDIVSLVTRFNQSDWSRFSDLEIFIRLPPGPYRRHNHRRRCRCFGKPFR